MRMVIFTVLAMFVAGQAVAQDRPADSNPSSAWPAPMPLPNPTTRPVPTTSATKDGNLGAPLGLGWGMGRSEFIQSHPGCFPIDDLIGWETTVFGSNAIVVGSFKEDGLVMVVISFRDVREDRSTAALDLSRQLFKALSEKYGKPNVLKIEGTGQTDDLIFSNSIRLRMARVRARWFSDDTGLTLDLQGSQDYKSELTLSYVSVKAWASSPSADGL